jgi:hypothetical protein
MALIPNWQEYVYSNFGFLREVQDFSRESMILIARQIQDIVDDDPTFPIFSVYESSIWGLAQAYREFVGDHPSTLSDSDLQYVRHRGGILGMHYDSQDVLTVISFRDLLDAYDPSFSYWLEDGHFGPPAA